MITKTLTLPGNHGPGLNKDQGISPPPPAAHDPGPEHSVSGANPRALDCALIHSELMSQRDDLKLQRAPRPKHAGEKRQYRTHNGLHGSGSYLFGSNNHSASLIGVRPEKHEEHQVVRIIGKDKVIGLQITDAGEDECEASPWLRSPSRKSTPIPIVESLPSAVRGVLSQRLCIETVGLPSALINQIKRLAAFQNPEFYKKQNLRLSMALTPRVISCADDHGKHVSLPRGCVDDVRTLLQEHRNHLDLEDLRQSGEAVEGTFLGQLTDAQRQAAKALLEHDNGVIVAPPGFGKTVLGTYLIAQRKCSTLILVHRQPLLEQWRSQIGIFLDRDLKSIGQLGGGKRKLTGQIDVAMIQSLNVSINPARTFRKIALAGCYGCQLDKAEKPLGVISPIHHTG